MAGTASIPTASAIAAAPAPLPPSISDLGAAYASGETDPRATTERFLAAIDGAQPRLNAFVTAAAGMALEAADAAAARWRRGQPLSPLDGVPISVKDMFDVAGLPSRRGSRVTSSAPVTADAPVAARLRKAGAVIVGLTTTAEFGGAPVTVSPLTGITRNAWNPSRTAGGSSGGAAVSVSAGLCMGALASDTGGSIRLPAAFNGVVGLKPTGGRLPTDPASVLRTLGCPGPMARSVADCAEMLTVMADPRYGSDEPIYPAFRGAAADDEPLRLGVSRRLGHAPYLDAEVDRSFETAIAAIAQAGIPTADIEPDVGDPVETFMAHTRANYAAILGDLDDGAVGQLSDGVRATRAAGLRMSATDLIAAFAARQRFADALQAAFADIDVLMTPAVAVPPFAAEAFAPETIPDGLGPRAWCPFGYPINLAELPAMVLPCGRTADGLPLAVQLIARKWREDQLLAMATRLERVFDFDSTPSLALTGSEAPDAG